MESSVPPARAETCPECGSAMDRAELPGRESSGPESSGPEDSGQPARLVCPRCNHEERAEPR